MLLYATVEHNDYYHTFAMPPHKMAVATVNLAMNWEAIERRLHAIIDE